jgi:hypothetical protein
VTPNHALQQSGSWTEAQVRPFVWPVALRYLFISQKHQTQT